jgi:hypothetical protein
MISCNEFILFYNEIFRDLDRTYGHEACARLWDHFSDNSCQNLEEHVKKDGLKGMFDYWTGTMGEEGGRFVLCLRENEFILDMHFCPSVGKLANTHVKPYEDYCGHCPALYKPVIERYGFTVEYTIINREKGACRIHVRDPRLPASKAGSGLAMFTEKGKR